MGTVLLRPFCEVRQPFFDHRVVDLVTHMTPLYRSKEKLVLGQYLSKRNPDLAVISYERTGLPANASLKHQLLKYMLRGVKKTAGTFLPFLREKPKVAINYMTWFKNDATLQAYVRDLLLDKRSLGRSHINAKAMEGLLQELFDGRPRSMPLIPRLMSLELWYRYFVDGDKPPSFKRG
jgi:asparagine synthetase B (glutamine-hydrolysing)